MKRKLLTLICLGFLLLIIDEAHSHAEESWIVSSEPIYTVGDCARPAPTNGETCAHSSKCVAGPSLATPGSCMVLDCWCFTFDAEPKSKLVCRVIKQPCHKSSLRPESDYSKAALEPGFRSH